MAVVPRSGREALSRALKADKVLSGADPNIRAAYELRAQRCEPGLEPGAAPKELEESK